MRVARALPLVLFPFLGALGAAPVAADRLDCTLRLECGTAEACRPKALHVRFAIDRHQFLPPVDRADPPRRKVTQVTAGDARFEAEPMIFANGTRGFWAGGAGGDRMLTISPGGAAVYTETAPARRYAGTCRDVE